MQLILKYRAGLSELNETSVEFDGEFEKTIAQLKDINSDIHQRFDEELDEVQILKSKVGIEFDKANNQIISKIIYKLDQEPNQEELNIIIEETAGQLTDGYGEEPWKVKLSKGIVFISLINFSKSEYLNPVEVKLLPGKKISDIFSKLRSILPKKNCTKKIEKAVENGDLELVKDFIKNEGNINCNGKWKQTLLMKAIQSNQEEMALYLIENAAEVNRVDDDNGTALSRAVGNGFLDIARQLIEKGADVNHVSSGIIHHGRTPLIYASSISNLDLVKLLVEKGAIINVFSENGESPLTQALSVGVIKYLLSNGANPYLSNHRGFNAIEDIKDTVNWLEKYDINKSKEIIKDKKKAFELIENYTKNNTV